MTATRQLPDGNNAGRLPDDITDVLRAGYKVFPLGRDGKKPSMSGGFYRGTDNSQKLAEQAASRPGCAWAIPTGLPSEMVVIEGDNAEAVAWLTERFGREPDVRTKRGAHFYFDHPGDRRLGNKVDVFSHDPDKPGGIDRKGDGGYVAIPPSPNKSWVNGIPDRRSLPALPDEFCDDEADVQTDASHDGKINADAADAIAAEIPANGRHDLMLKLAGTMLDGGVSEADTTATLLKAWSDAGALSDEARRDIEGGVASTAAKRKTDVPAWGRTALDKACPGLSDKLRVAYGWIKSKDVLTSGKAHVAASAPAEAVERPDEGSDKPDSKPDEKPADKADKTPARDRMYLLAARHCTPFKDQYGDPFVQTDEGDIVPLKSANDWLSLLWLGKTGNVARGEDLKAVRDMLSARARTGDRQYTLHTRFAQHGKRVCFDLMDDRVAVVEPDGWRVVPYAESPVLFRPNNSADPIPTPVRGGNLDELNAHLRTAEPSSARLRAAWIATAPLADADRPIMETTGDAGSGKTTDQRMIKRLIDPCKADVLKMRRKALLQNLLFHAVPLFDNLSHIDEETSNDLCSAATGVGYEDRELYTQEQQVAREFKRAIMINGVAVPGDKSDLQSRVLPIRLTPPAEGERKTGAAMELAFEAARPRLLGAVLDALSAALRHFDPHAPIPSDTRLADWAVYLGGVYEHAGWGRDTMLEDLAGLDSDRAEAVIDGSIVARMVLRLAEALKLPWTGSMTDLYERCKNLADNTEGTLTFPRNPSSFSRRVSEAKAAMKARGLIVITRRTTKGVVVTLSRPGDDVGNDVGKCRQRGDDVGISTPMPTYENPIATPNGANDVGDVGISPEKSVLIPLSASQEKEGKTGDEVGAESVVQNAYIAYSTDTPEYAILTALQREPMTTPEVMDAAGVPLYEWLKYLPPLEAAGLVRSERVPADLGTIQRWYLNTQTDR